MIEQKTLPIENKNTRRFFSPKGFLTSAQACKKAQMSLQTLYKLYHQEKVEGKQLLPNSPIYFNENSLDEFLKKSSFIKSQTGRVVIAPVGYLTNGQVMEKTKLSTNQVTNLYHKGLIEGVQKDKGSPIFFKEKSVQDFVSSYLKDENNAPENSAQITEQNALDFSNAKKINWDFKGSYINILKEYPELIERLRGSIKAYKDFDSQDGLSGVSAQKWLKLHGHAEANNTYFDFLLKCIVADIEELELLMVYENANL